MKKIIIYIVISYFVSTITASPKGTAGNCNPNITITGKVLAHHSRLPVAKVEVEITCASLKNTTFKCVTNALGRFRFHLPDSLIAKDIFLGPTHDALKRMHNFHSEIRQVKIPIDDFPFKKNVVLYKYAFDRPQKVVTAKLITHLTKQAEYVGGNGAMIAFLQKNIFYPPMERDNEIQGTVCVRFMVDENGAIKDVKVIKSINPGLDKEAMRVIKLMPNWQPAEYHYKPVRVYYFAPVEFHLQ